MDGRRRNERSPPCVPPGLFSAGESAAENWYIWGGGLQLAVPFDSDSPQTLYMLVADFMEGRFGKRNCDFSDGLPPILRGGLTYGG